MLNKAWTNIKKYYKVYGYKLKLFKFYEQDSDKSVSILSMLSNLVFLNLVLIIIAYIWFIQRTRKMILSLIMTLILVFLFNMAFYLRRKKLHKIKRNQKRKAIAFDYLMDKLKQLSDEEFMWQMMTLLFKLPGIGDIKNKSTYLESTLKGEKIAIGYFNDKFNKGIDLNSLTLFLNNISMEGYKEAIFITTGTFSDESKVLLTKKKSIKIHALDKESLFQLMEKSDLLPSKSIVDSLIEEKLTRRVDIKDVKNEIINKKKIRTYFGFSILFMVLSGILSTHTLYYIIISAIFLFLALVSHFNGESHDKDKDKTNIIINELTKEEVQAE